MGRLKDALKCSCIFPLRVPVSFGHVVGETSKTPLTELITKRSVEENGVSAASCWCFFLRRYSVVKITFPSESFCVLDNFDLIECAGRMQLQA